MEHQTPAELGFLKPAYTIGELTSVLPCGRSRIYEEIKAGRLRAIKVGGRSVVMAMDAAAYLLRCSRESEAA